MESSYSNKTLTYGDLFTLLTWQIKPKTIVEFGILNGYSLEHFRSCASDNTRIYAYDIFEKFVGNSAKRNIKERFAMYPNVFIEDGDFYTKYNTIEDGTIDILHIDIANNGDVYEFAIQNYLKKISPRGVMILEGGSVERDNVEWMLKYKKNPIVPVLDKYKSSLDIKTFDSFPSATLICPR
jgi:predicted O-methyltransferase YrrM